MICSWCGKEDPQHSGGFETYLHEEVEGKFCDRLCFERWLKAHAILDRVTA